MQTATVWDPLRVQDEPFVFVREDEVHERLSGRPEQYLAFLESHLSRIARQPGLIELPNKTIFPDGPGAGDFRVMPCVYRGIDPAVKTVKVVGTNLLGEKVRDQVTVGKAMRLDPRENFVTHIFEACLLSSARTGACAALAARRLSTETRRAGLVGAGRVGLYAILFLAAGGGVETVRICDRTTERAEGLAIWVRENLGLEARSCPAEDVFDSDLLVLATTSTVPILRPSESRASLLISLGADTPDQHELSSDWAVGADLYCDGKDSLEVGDLARWRGEEGFDPARVRDLTSLYSENSIGSRERRRVFISTGTALLDNLTIAYLLRP